jgi:hypothetical protein
MKRTHRHFKSFGAMTRWANNNRFKFATSLPINGDKSIEEMVTRGKVTASISGDNNIYVFHPPISRNNPSPVRIRKAKRRRRAVNIPRHFHSQLFARATAGGKFGVFSRAKGGLRLAGPFSRSQLHAWARAKGRKIVHGGHLAHLKG